MQAPAHFQLADPVLYEASLAIGEIPQVSKRRSKVDHFTELCASIVSQQLSTKVADVIWERVKKVCAEQKTILRPSDVHRSAQDDSISPEVVLEVPTEVFRKQGLSYAKIKYIKDLAQKVRDQEVDLEKLDDLSDEDVIVELVKVKGIGKWTAEMFLMFSLGRPDVFSTGDLGLKRAIQKLYGLDHEPTEEELLEMSAKWSPHRTTASRVLWRTLDNTPKV